MEGFFDGEDKMDGEKEEKDPQNISGNHSGAGREVLRCIEEWHSGSLSTRDEGSSQPRSRYEAVGSVIKGQRTLSQYNY